MKTQTIRDGLGKLIQKKGSPSSHEGIGSQDHTQERFPTPRGSRIIAFLFFIGNFILQTWSLRTQARPFTDEGLHLYEAKLMVEGYLPYKDFAMPNHVPFLIYLNGLVLELCHLDMFTYHIIYTAWVFLSIFPLFYTVLHFTRSRLASSFSVILFSTFVECVQWDVHLFAIRQGSFPLFACFIYLFFVKKNVKLSQIFLSLFSFCLITNFLTSLAFVLVVFLYGCVEQKSSIGQWIKKYLSSYWVFVVLNSVYFGLILLIPGSIANLLVEAKNPSSYWQSYLQRVVEVQAMMPLNWPIFFFGALGIFFFLEEVVLLALLAMLTFLIALSIPGPFYTHHLVIIALPFSIMGGIFLQKVLLALSSGEVKSALVRTVVVVRKMALVGLILFAVYQTVYPYLSQTIVVDTTPEFFQTIQVLEHAPDPVFTLIPIYAFYARKDVVKDYSLTDMRSVAARGANLPYQEYDNIVRRSNTVILESFADQMLPEGIKQEIVQQFSCIYADGTESVYVRKTFTNPSSS